MTNTQIQKLGLSVIAASVAAYFVTGLQRRCRNDPATCLCRLNKTIFRDIVLAVRHMR